MSDRVLPVCPWLMLAKDGMEMGVMSVCRLATGAIGFITLIRTFLNSDFSLWGQFTMGWRPHSSQYLNDRSDVFVRCLILIVVQRRHRYRRLENLSGR